MTAKLDADQRIALVHRHRGGHLHVRVFKLRYLGFPFIGVN